MDRLNQITPYILEAKCILFVGAGLSRIAGCYDWDSVVARMFDHPVMKEKFNAKDIYDIRQSKRFSNEELIEFCEGVFTRGGLENDFWSIVREALIKDPQKFSRDYCPIIKKMKELKPFPKIITTNIDSCLEETRELELNKIFYERSDFTVDHLNGNTTGVFHIHGYIEKFKDSLLTKGKYSQLYKEQGFQTFLKRVFSDYSVLFLGYSFRDQEIKDIVLGAQKSKKHFALVPEEDEFSASEIAVFSDLYGIKVIVYGCMNDFTRLFGSWVDKNFSETDLKQEDQA